MAYGPRLGFTTISVPNQSPVDMGPLPERLVVDLQRNMTSGADGAFSRLVPAIPPSPTRIEPPITVFLPNLRHPAETRSKLAWVKTKGEAPSARWGFVGEILMGIHPPSPTVPFPLYRHHLRADPVAIGQFPS
jgi:hypothetical protein